MADDDPFTPAGRAKKRDEQIEQLNQMEQAVLPLTENGTDKERARAERQLNKIRQQRSRLTGPET
jgi:hypothetical protein